MPRSVGGILLEKIECAVVGAGVIGLAIARRLAMDGREVVILEETDAIGSSTSSRNSEVVHAGIYYPRDSLKARLCVEGRKRLYAYMDERGIAYRRCGKLIVATTEAQLGALQTLRGRAEANGVDDLRWIEGDEVHALEPELRGVAALASPSSGIFDTHGLMLSYRGEAEDAGAMIAFKSPVVGGRIVGDGILIEVGGAEPMEIACDILVNSAGLGAQGLSRRIEGIPADTIPPLYFAKGNYFTLAGRAPFRHLIYPVPESAGLGIHLTLDLGGQARFGPDVEWIETLDYDVDPARSATFYEAIRRYWPGLKDGALQTGYAGIRPKVHAPDEPARDFIIQGPADHGVPGYVALYGMESPGLTASLAIADVVAEKLG